MPFGLYLHFPFCNIDCSYCDFYKEHYECGLEENFYKALTIETELTAAQYAPYDREVTSIYVGGGTPSITNLNHFSRWFYHLKRHFHITDGIEFSIECNPESITLESLIIFKELGVNRPVFGIQSFDSRLLKILNRKHHPHHSHRAIYWANALGYKNFGADFIFGLPEQTSRMLSADLDQLIDLAPTHISFYQLTVEAGTELAANISAGFLKMPDPELAIAMYRGGCQRMMEAGYGRYEVSSFARKGYECKHNLGYWEGNDYLGLGPSAHSFMNGKHFANVFNLQTYITETRAGRLPRIIDKSGVEQRMSEAIILGLRTSRGISRSQFSERFGAPIETRLNREHYRLLVESGHLVPDRKNLRLSEEGIYIVDEITRRLID